MRKLDQRRNRRLNGLEEFPERDRNRPGSAGERRRSGGWREGLPLIIPGLIVGVMSGYVLSADDRVSDLPHVIGTVSHASVAPEPSLSKVAPPMPAPASVQRSPSSVPTAESKAGVSPAKIYYAGCNEVRAAGRAPLYKGEPGYREGMDGDGDGIACEPIRYGSGKYKRRRF